MGKVVAIVQARTTSERFPCKIFAGLLGRPMLAHVLERAAAIQGVDQVVLAVPENDVRLVSHLWPYVYGGSEKDVLGRYAGAAEQYEADVVLRVTGDCPLLAPDLAKSALYLYMHITGDGYFPYCQPYHGIADGWDCEVFSRRVLVNADRYSEKADREHVTTFMRKGIPEESPSEWMTYLQNWAELKCSVDTREDLQRVELIMNHLDDKTDFSHQATWQAWERAGKP